MLRGKYALITGASRGIGRGIAETLAQAGASVAVTSRRSDECRETALELGRRFGIDAIGAAGDVSTPDGVEAIFETVESWSGGRLDVLVSNAGYPMDAAIWNSHLHAAAALDLQKWCVEVFRTDCLGAVLCTRRALQLMIPAGGGSLIYISSTPAIEGYQGTPYTAAKAAVLGLMRDVAREYGRHGIRANALALGNIRTPATWEALDEATREALAAEAPLGRWGEPEEVGRVALFLASEMSSFVTGQTLVVDGGTIRR